MKIENLGKYKNPYQWEFFIRYDIIFKNGKVIRKTVSKSSRNGIEIILEEM